MVDDSRHLDCSASAIQAAPEILAPAGDQDCFMAALAAGADAVYLGLKHFSARMEAENFGLGQLARLTDLAHDENRRVYVAMNSLIKPGEAIHAFRLTKRLAAQVHVDGLIIQDLAMLDMARQAGFTGMIALSTLANISSPTGLEQAFRLGANRVILPRELSIDEIRQMGAGCPSGLGLECFIHGALCYCVSGRCYWSSYMGGKSGLRGRCVQPCRRIYAKSRQTAAHGANSSRNMNGGQKSSRPMLSDAKRYFSCQDLRLGSIAKTLLSVPNLVSWKIEGRKKGPHYVFHAVTAYRMLRDNPGNPSIRKTAEDILDMALGRPGGKGRFLPQKKYYPMSPDGQTSSGLLAGKINIQRDGTCVLKPHFNLLAKDYLRIGVEDERWHATLPVNRNIPKGGNLVLRLAKHKTPKTGVHVYLVDRREPELMALLKSWQNKLVSFPERHISDVSQEPHMPRCVKSAMLPDMRVFSAPVQGKIQERNCRHRGKFANALWLTPKNASISRPLMRQTTFWLPPVIWPENEEIFQNLVKGLLRNGVKRFVCNAPWQRSLFPDSLPADIWLAAGPFCNIANAIAVKVLRQMDYCAAFASPELPAADLLSLPGQSCLPLGLVLAGFWPVGISRFGLMGINANEPFCSPKGETFWARDYAGTFWLYPSWPLDLTEKRMELTKAGYSFFAFLEEKPPSALAKTDRPGLFNWDCALL